MQKWMCLGSLIVAALTLLLCLADLFIGEPFGGGPFILPDIGGIIAAGTIGYMAWNAYKDVR